MQFTATNINKSINDVMRMLGYIPSYFQNEGEFSMVKKISRNDYPRFHLYIIQHGADVTFKLHLDQKKPSYEGVKGHSGDYDGDVVLGEAERIKQILSS
jgi:hypothetical protein